MTNVISDKQLKRLGRLIGPAAAKQWFKVLTRARSNNHHRQHGRAQKGKSGRRRTG